MKKELKLSVGQYSSAGRKPLNQDFHGAYIPKQPLLDTKGVVIALADGISSSDVSQIASETAVTSFIEDYYCTSESWSVKSAAQKVLKATNSWLHSQTFNSPYRFDKNKGYVCTFSSLIFKSNSVHLFHVGDCRIYRLANRNLEQLTHDHRKVISEELSYLSKGLGIHDYLEIDYCSLPVQEGDVFILASDGVYEFISRDNLISALTIESDNMDDLAKRVVEQAYSNGSDDNLSLQIVRVDSLPARKLHELQDQIHILPPAPKLEAGQEFDGYDVIRELYISSRSHVYLGKDIETRQQVVIKTPSTEMRHDEHCLEQFLMEDWVAKRLNNPHIVRAFGTDRQRQAIYTVTEYIEGKTLAQWMIDNPSPSLDQVRSIIEQIAKGLQAFHRQEMIHQDLRPNNIMIDAEGVVRIIDFGATKIAGVQEITMRQQEIVGTAQYTAPEYFLGDDGTSQSDIFSLGVITYQLLSAKLPYGNQISKTQSMREQQRLRYRSLASYDTVIPGWVDFAIQKSCEINPEKRYQEVAEFVYELKRPNRNYLSRTRPPLIERNPTLFWQTTSFILLCALIYQSIT